MNIKKYGKSPIKETYKYERKPGYAVCCSLLQSVLTHIASAQYSLYMKSPTKETYKYETNRVTNT